MDLDTIAIMKDEFDKHSAGDHLCPERQRISLENVFRVGREFFGWMPSTTDRMNLSQKVGDEIDFIMFLVIMKRAQTSMWRSVEQHMENGFAALGSSDRDTIPLSRLAVTLESFAGMDGAEVSEMFGAAIDDEDDSGIVRMDDIRSLILSSEDAERS